MASTKLAATETAATPTARDNFSPVDVYKSFMVVCMIAVHAKDLAYGIRDGCGLGWTSPFLYFNQVSPPSPRLATHSFTTLGY